jgi:hypothetical protein
VGHQLGWRGRAWSLARMVATIGPA